MNQNYIEAGDKENEQYLHVNICEKAGYHQLDLENIQIMDDSLDKVILVGKCKVCGAQVIFDGSWEPIEDVKANPLMEEFSEDDSIEKIWENIKNRLLMIQYTKLRTKELRKDWRQYKKDEDWKNLIKKLSDFAIEKGIQRKKIVSPFDKTKLRLVAIDFIS